MPTNAVRAMLEAYAVTGVLGLARRDGNRRYYDLIERLLPADVIAHDLPLREQLRHKLLSRYRAHGLLGVGGVATSSAGSARRSRIRGGRRARDGTRCARSLSSSTSSFPLTSRACAASASSSARTSGCWKRRRSRHPRSRSFPHSTRWSGTAACSEPVRVRLRVGALPAARQTPLGLVRAAGRLPGPLRRPDRAANRQGRCARGGARRLVGGRLCAGRAEGFVDAIRDALGAYLRFAGTSRLEWAPHLATEKRLFP
jgi:hypothetical protein